VNKKNIYFASDFHFGAPDKDTSRERETRVIRWLDSIKEDAERIFLLGDLFDFWHEYKTVVPKGNIRFLGKLAELTDAGIPIEVFTGNHDLWMYGYFEEELGIPVHHEPQQRVYHDKSFLIGHGDGLGPGDKTFKHVRKIFHNKFFQFIFRIVHPDIGIWIANEWSKRSRGSHTEQEEFLGEEKEYLIAYCKTVLKTERIDYFVFGHRHLPIEFEFADYASTYFNLGEWFSQNNYGVYDGQKMELREFTG